MTIIRGSHYGNHFGSYGLRVDQSSLTRGCLPGLDALHSWSSLLLLPDLLGRCYLCFPEGKTKTQLLESMWHGWVPKPLWCLGFLIIEWG